MRYIIAYYADPTTASKRSIPFGVILNTDNGLIYKFDTSKQRENLIKSASENFDAITFENFARTFEQSYINRAIIYSSDGNGQRRSINTQSDEFLDYLSENSQNTYQYSVPLPIDASEEPNNLLDQLMQAEVASFA